MITNIFMHQHAFYTLSLVMMLSLHTTTANQLVAGVINKCMENERHALLDFKAHLQDHDGLLSKWRVEEEDCCIWSGVTCNETTGHVIRLHLWYNLGDGDLVGEISPSLLNLTYLTHLDLSHNLFSGTIPRFIGYMTRLRYLNLGWNNFKGTIPTSIGFLTQLRYLDLGTNNFNGTILSSISSLTQLRYLDLGVNNFTGTIHTFTGSMTRLRNLNLCSNNFSGTIPHFIGSLTELRYLHLEDNSLYGSVPPEIGNLTKLETFTLGCSGRCVIENVDWLTRLSSLHELRMNGIFLAKSNHWENVIQWLQKLSVLWLSKCDLSQVMYPPSSIINSSSYSSIVYLSLPNNNLNSSMYRWLFPLTSNRLEELDLSGNMLDGIPKYLGSLCGLTYLQFNDNSAVVKLSDFLHNLSGCTSATLQAFFAKNSQFTGSLSDEIQNFVSLGSLYMSLNILNGTISDKVWELPTLYTLDVSSNYLRGAISQNIGKSKIATIDISNNSLMGVLVSSEDHMENLSYVEYIDLRSCMLGPRFPRWVQKLKDLTHLDISNTRISDTIPMEFWGTWPSQLTYLNLSRNNISGEVPDLSSNFGNSSAIDLSSNNLYGVIPNVHSTLVLLNLSGNKFYGGITFLCQLEFLEYLDLSNNFLTGKIPDCFWHFKELKVLNLAQNNLYGRLPASFESLIKLEVLYVYKNNLSGELPLSLKNCTSLNYLNLGANKFSGNVPVWIGETLSRLYVLSLRSNNFSGTIPLQLCRLVNLQVLDLSRNNLYGTIPTCINNLTTMVEEEFIPTRTVHDLLIPWNTLRVGSPGEGSEYDFNEYIDHAAIEWQGNVREFGRTNLGLLRSIDLSSNHLTGQLPYELTDLHGLLALNLSKNALQGGIPREVGHMKKLLTLDISRNKFSGEIPSSMSQMTLLSYLDVSYNNLSGKIPSSTQLQSFEPWRYIGNAGICGPPVTKECPGDEESQVPPLVGEREGGEEDKDELERWFYIGGGIGFATGFWIACGILVLNHKCRHDLFHFLNRLKDWIYVKLVVFIAKLRRGFHDI